MSGAASVHMRSKRLRDILPDTAIFFGDPDVFVTGICADSRRIQSGDLFVARKGLHVRGSDFIAEACNSGASAILTSEPDADNCNTTVAVLTDMESQVSKVADEFYDNPSRDISVTGVTGTNGKTSCCYWYAWLSNQLDKSCGQIGTLGAGYQSGISGVKNDDTAIVPTGFTTPDAVAVQKLLADIRDAGAKAVVMEVSSHALDQGRAEAVNFEAAVFTNLTQDHLDYHQSMSAYFAVKATLFARPELQRVILNKDDGSFAELSAVVRDGVKIYSYSLADTSADLHFSEVVWTGSGAEASVNGKWGSAILSLPVIGKYNLSNVLAVMTALLASGVTMDLLAKALADLPSVPGRMQLISKPGMPAVVVDYAHTPDAVKKALTAIRPQVAGRLISVLGCGGDRDQEKRPLMGRYASANSDQSWFTSDNPRSENPKDIIDAMVLGAGSDNVCIEPDRKIAIEDAIASATSSDLVIVLGKGHETYQEIAGERYPYSDLDHCESVLARQRSVRGAR